MSTETKTLLFNAVPLFAIAVAYGAVSIAIVPTLWRNRSRATAGDLTVATIFPAIAIVAAIYGVVVATNQTPVADELWLVVRGDARRARPGVRVPHPRGARGPRQRRRAGARGGGAHDRARPRAHGRHRARDRARPHADRRRGRADDHRRGGEGARRRVRLVRPRRGRPERGDRRHRASRRRRRPVGRRDGSTCATSLPAPRAPSSTVRRSPSTTRRRRRSSTARSSSARTRGASRTRRSSPRVACSRSSRSRASRNSARSARTSCACSSRSRNEAALALDRLRSSSALAKALERERLISRIAARFRTQLDLDTVLRVAVEETARALGAQRAFVRIGKPGENMPIAAEWVESGLEPLDAGSPRAAGLEPRAPRAENRRGRRHRGRTRRSPSFAGRARGAARDRHPLGACDADRRLRRGDRRLRAASHDGRPLDRVRRHRRRGRRARGRPRRCASRGCSASARSRCASRRACSAPRRTSPPSSRSRRCCSGSSTSSPRCSVSTPPTSTSTTRGERMLRCAAVHGLPDDARRLRVPGRARALRPRRPARRAGHLDRRRRGREPIPHDAYGGFTSRIFAPIVESGETRGVLGAGGARASAGSASATPTSSAPSPRSRRSRCGTPRRTRSGRGRRACSAASRSIATVLGEPLSLTATLDAVAQAAAEALGGDFTAVLMPRSDGELELAGALRAAAVVRAQAPGRPSPGRARADALRRRRGA